MPVVELKCSAGVAALLFAARRTSPLNGDRYYLSGDLEQMSCAYKEAKKLELPCDDEGGIPFVIGKTAFDTLIKHLYEHKLPGYTNYPAPR